MTQPHRQPAPPNSHGACGATWTGGSAAHCSGCCKTFVGPSLFDAHRSARGERGDCIDPETLTNRAGDRIAFYRDGMWRGPEMTDAQKAARFGDKGAA
jgi:hypothetical protein